MCRAVLIESEELLVKKHPVGKNGKTCSSYFLEDPPSWFVNDDASVTEGKLMCFQCQARVGYWNWSGTKCSCGVWVTPAFQLVRSKLDVRTLPIVQTIVAVNEKEEVVENKEVDEDI